MAVLTDSKLSGFIGIKELLTLWGPAETDGNRVPPGGYQSFLFSMLDFPDNDDVNSEK